MNPKVKNLINLFKATYVEWDKKDPFKQSAVIAYYAIFSLPGLLVLIITIAGYFYGKDVASKNILDQISGTMGVETSDQIKSMLLSVSTSKSTIWATIVGVLILIFGATGVFVELQKTFNLIWHVSKPPQKGFLRIIESRLFSFGLILAIAFLLLISLIISSVIAAFSNWINAETSQFMTIVFYILNFIFSLVVISSLFALMFKILPDAKIKWREVWLGAFVTGLLFTIGKTGLAFYFGKANPGQGYGAAGSVILILLWVSYSSLILFFGAQFTACYAKMYSSKTKRAETSSNNHLVMLSKSND